MTGQWVSNYFTVYEVQVKLETDFGSAQTPVLVFDPTQPGFTGKKY